MKKTNKKFVLIMGIVTILCLLFNVIASADYTNDPLLDIESGGEAGAWDYDFGNDFGISLMSASTVKTYSKSSQGNTKLSNNFTVKEFACKDGSDTVLIDSELVSILQNIRDHFGRAVTINSGYRTVAYNKRVGGASSSYHTKGMAADISVSGISPSTVAAYAETIGVRGVGRYSSFVHVDTRPSKFYWKNSSVTRVNTHGGVFNSQPYSNGGGGGGSTEPITISNVRYENFDDGGFNILCDVSGASKVLFPTWTTGDQSDIIWEESEFDGHTANCRINASAYGWKNGLYITHIYAYNNSGGVNSTVAGSVTWPDKENPQLSNVQISDISAGGYTITCNVSDNNGIARVSGASWNDEIGREPEYGGTTQGKTVWFDGSVNGNTATIRVNTSEFGNRTGTYTTHLYAWDTTGRATATSIHVFVDNYKYNLEGINFKNNTLSIGGWAIYKNGQDNMKIVLQIDDMSEIECTRLSRSDVHNAYPSYPKGNEGFYIELKGKDLPNGKHTVVVKAYINDKCAFELGRKEFTSMTDHIAEHTIVKNNHIYSIFNSDISWSDAQKLAENKGGYLATVTSSEEQNIINELLEYASLGQYWLGATSEGVEGEGTLGDWRWLTGEDFNYTNWHKGEPNNDGGKEYYAGVYSNGTWNDFRNTQKNIGYIMETEISGEPVASIENEGHYYYLYDNEVDWHGAKAFCEAMGGHLVTITNKKEQALVQSLTNQGSSEFDAYFIGASNNEDSSTWKWVTDEKFDYTNWNDGEPSNTNDIEHYAEIYKRGTWNDRESFNNGSKDGFICEIETDDTYTAKTEYNGNTYLRIDKSLSWEDAKAYCEVMGGHLVTITDEDEQEAIEDLLCRGVDTLRSAYAIGGTDTDSEGNWKWITGEAFDYKNWNNGEPNNGGGSSKGSQDYLTICSKSDSFGMWDDNWNFNRNPYDIGFICEIEDIQTTPEPIITPEPVEIPTPDVSTPKPEKPVQPDIDESLSTVTIGTVSAVGGETIAIPVSISNNQGICEGKFVLNYDSTRLTPLSIENGEKFANGTIQSNIESISEDKNSLTVTWENSSIADNTENGDMFYVTFKVADNAAPGIIPISIDKAQLDVINADGQDININVVDGGAAIAWPIISVDNVKSQAGSTIVVPVKMENNTGINAFGFTVEYDNQVMTPIEVTTGDVTNGKGNMQSNLDDTSIDWNNQAEVTASWLSDDLENDILENGVLFNIRFKIKESAETGFYPVKIKYTDGDITNAIGAEIGVTTTSGGVAVEKAQFTYGDVNCDGKINIIDIVLMRKHYANLPIDISETGLLAADVNADGKIDNKDILLMRKYVAKWNGIVLGK